MVFPVEPTEPLPTWATNIASIKVPPPAQVKDFGWQPDPGTGIGPRYPYQWYNNELFNNGQWMSYCKDSLLYIKAGNFDGPIVAQGNITSKADLITESSLIIRASDAIAYNQFVTNTGTGGKGYTLPDAYPALNSILGSTPSGVMSWKTEGNRVIYQRVVVPGSTITNNQGFVPIWAVGLPAGNHFLTINQIFLNANAVNSSGFELSYSSTYYSPSPQSSYSFPTLGIIGEIDNPARRPAQAWVEGPTTIYGVITNNTGSNMEFGASFLNIVSYL